MTNANGRAHPGGAIGSLFTFALLALFAMISLLIVLAGARVYRTVEQTSAENHTSRTAMAYLLGKVRAHDAAGMIGIQEEAGQPVLVLGSVLHETRYNTYIYFSDGAICEYFGDAARAFDPSLGAEIAEAAAFIPSLDDEMLTLSISDTAGRTRSVPVLLRTGEAVG